MSRNFDTDSRTQARLKMGMYSPEAKAARMTGHAVKCWAVNPKRAERLLAQVSAATPNAWAMSALAAMRAGTFATGGGQ